MPADVRIRDGGFEAKVTPEGALRVSTSPYPPFGAQQARPFRQYLTVDGTAGGSNDMGVDGSVTNVDFYVPASDTADRYITNLAVLVGYGGTAQPYLFADAVALANGCRLHFVSLKGEVDIHDGIKTNQDMFRLSHEAVRSDWEVRGVNANNDYGYFITIDLESVMPVFGVKLDAGTTQRLIMTIRDDCTNAESFNVIAYGFDRFE